MPRSIYAALLLGFGLVTVSGRSPTSAQQPPTPPAPQQPSEIRTTISGEAGAPPRLAVPDFIALTSDAETDAIAKTIAQVLFDDLSFEREFGLIPRDIYATIPTAKSVEGVAFDPWLQLNSQAVATRPARNTPPPLPPAAPSSNPNPPPPPAINPPAKEASSP